MPKQKGSKLNPGSPQREPFVTIDDLAHQAQELVNGLQKLGAYKYPLDVRRGIVLVGKGVMTTMKEKKDRRAKRGRSGKPGKSRKQTA